MCYPCTLPNVPAVKWSVKNENNARDEYKSISQGEHINSAIDPCGLFIDHENTYLDTSPDAIVCFECCGRGCLILLWCLSSALHQAPPLNGCHKN